MRRHASPAPVEAVPGETHPESGSHVIQLTSGASIDCNLYCEVPYMDAGSRYVMFTRGGSSAPPRYA